MSKEINMDIEVGDYVRSRNGSIGKVTKIEDDKYLYENKELITFIGNIVKHSKNIIDLIEVGDILEIYLRDDKKYTIYVPIESENQLKATKKDLNIDILKTILTKEQYIQNCYTVERS